MIDYTELGATLFIPASFSSLKSIVSEKKYPALKSLVIDFEDGLADASFDKAMQEINGVLESITSQSPLVFLRAKDENHLNELLKLKAINNITGFVLAKFSLSNAKKYLYLVNNEDFLFMPSIEGEELFEHSKLQELKALLLMHKQKILLLRFGLEDMLRQLSMSRKCDESIFDFAATSSVIGNFIATFKSAGFAISGGVYPCFKDAEGFVKDVERDLREGLFSKTIIHPSQIELAHQSYKVTKEELDRAQEITKKQDLAVFGQDGKMAEISTMLPFAKEIIRRSKTYGLKNF